MNWVSRKGIWDLIRGADFNVRKIEMLGGKCLYSSLSLIEANYSGRCISCRVQLLLYKQLQM